MMYDGVLRGILSNSDDIDSEKIMHIVTGGE